MSAPEDLQPEAAGADGLELPQQRAALNLPRAPSSTFFAAASTASTSMFMNCVVTWNSEGLALLS